MSASEQRVIKESKYPMLSLKLEPTIEQSNCVPRGLGILVLHMKQSNRYMYVMMAGKPASLQLRHETTINQTIDSALQRLFSHAWKTFFNLFIATISTKL
jgi:hypothetical protein